MRIWRWLLVTSTLAAGALGGQEAGVPSRDAMRKLAFLEGEWEGEATIQGQGGAMRLRQTESVRFSNSGHVLVVQGTGWEKDAAGAERIGFNALAVISHDPQAGYRMRSHTMEGRVGEFELTVSDSGFVWGMDVPGGHVTYTMRLTPQGEWREVGEFSRAGAPGRPFIEMLVRKKR